MVLHYVSVFGCVGTEVHLVENITKIVLCFSPSLVCVTAVVNLSTSTK